jgi:hypothetical protein
MLGVQTGGLGGGQNDVTALDTATPHSQVPRNRIIFLSCAIAAPNRELHVQSRGSVSWEKSSTVIESCSVIWIEA